jgi:metallo-beta-lactamase class B
MKRALLTFALAASSALAQPAGSLASEQWSRPFPPLRIVGNLYYVGTYDLACYLIHTPAGNILINTGLAESAASIRANIATLGFRFSDTKLLLATHAHWDHVSAMAEIKRLTGARLAATEADAALLESGGKSDFRWGEDRGAWFQPVKVDERLRDGQKVGLGGVELTVHLHPGHTKGAASYEFTVEDGGRGYRVLIANIPSINPGVTLLHNARYPGIAADYARAFAGLKELHPEIFLASHAAQFGLHQKYQPGDPYLPGRFLDPEGYQAAVARAQKNFDDQLQRERGGRRRLALVFLHTHEYRERRFCGFTAPPVRTPGGSQEFQIVAMGGIQAHLVGPAVELAAEPEQRLFAPVRTVGGPPDHHVQALALPHVSDVHGEYHPPARLRC